jgi:catechol 2,3-dioxygenase-like lactoylglutathione lyase family enzyme
MQPLICRVEHLGFAAHDPAGLAGWYAKCLGARRIWQNELQRPAVFVEMPGGLVLEIYPSSRSAAEITGDNSVSGLRHLALRVANIEAARDHLEKAGVVFAEAAKPAGGGGRVLFFKDPEGNLLHLVERPSNEPLSHV